VVPTTFGAAAFLFAPARLDGQTEDRQQGRAEVTVEGEGQTQVDSTSIRFESEADRLETEAEYDKREESQKLLGLFSVGSISRPATDGSLNIFPFVHPDRGLVEGSGDGVESGGYAVRRMLGRHVLGDLRVSSRRGMTGVGAETGRLRCAPFSEMFSVCSR